METITLPDGYRTSKKQPEMLTFRNPANVAELVAWCNQHSHIQFRANDGTARVAKVNGSVRTWKRDQNRVEVPIKYGMYEYGTFTQHDINRVLIPVDR